MSKLHDIETTAKIKLALVANPHVGALDIGVDTLNGIVFLKGAVQDNEQKSLAEELAREYGGLDVKNDIEVLSMIKDEDAEQATGSFFEAEDTSLRDRILGDLEADSRVNALMVNVREFEGIVRLSGIQETESARRRAEEIALKVDGVTEVINEIRVERRQAA